MQKCYHLVCGKSFVCDSLINIFLYFPFLWDLCPRIETVSKAKHLILLNIRYRQVSPPPPSKTGFQFKFLAWDGSTYNSMSWFKSITNPYRGHIISTRENWIARSYLTFIFHQFHHKLDIRQVQQFHNFPFFLQLGEYSKLVAIIISGLSVTFSLNELVYDGY